MGSIGTGAVVVVEMMSVTTGWVARARGLVDECRRRDGNPCALLLLVVLLLRLRLVVVGMGRESWMGGLGLVVAGATNVVGKGWWWWWLW